MSMKRVFLGFGVVLLVLSMMNVAQALSITDFTVVNPGATITSSADNVLPGDGIVSRNWQGTVGYGVKVGHVDGEIDGMGSGEWILVEFGIAQYIDKVRISALYAAGQYSDIVDETAFINYDYNELNLPTLPGASDFHVTVQSVAIDPTGMSYASMSGAGAVVNVSPALTGGGGVWDVINLFPGTPVNSLLFYVGPNANNTYSDYSIVSLDTTAVPLPGAVWLLGAGLVGLVGLRRRFVK